MDLSVSMRESQDVVILDFKGKLVLGEECDLLREHVQKLLAGHRKKILLNLGEVIRVDSGGIGTLVEVVVLAAKATGRLKLVHVPRLLHNSLVIHRLLQAFEIYGSEEEAFSSFQQEPQALANGD